MGRPRLGGQPYIQKVLGIQSANLIAYWPLDELSGTNADNAEGTAARDGTYTGVALDSATGPDGASRAGLWDGANDYCDIYSASLEAAFSAPPAGTIALWGRVSGAGVWTDGNTTNFNILLADGNNVVSLQKTNINDQLRFNYIGSATVRQVLKDGISDLGWMHLGLTWDTVADEMIAYFNGAQEGAIQTGIGTFVTALSVTNTVIGASSITPTFVTDGFIAHHAIWTTALTPAEMANLAIA